MARSLLLIHPGSATNFKILSSTATEISSRLQMIYLICLVTYSLDVIIPFPFMNKITMKFITFYEN